MPLVGLFVFVNGTLLLTLLALLVRCSCSIIVVQGKSMAPTLSAGDRLLVFYWWPRSLLQRGQIVVFQPADASERPVDTPEGIDTRSYLHVKRIREVAGATIKTSLEDLQEEQRLHFAKYYDNRGLRTWFIPSQHVFVQGDNQTASIDSTLFGPIPLKAIQAVVVMKLPSTFLLFARGRG